MKLANLLEHHRKHSRVPNALATNFGDGFLLAGNRVFKKVRDGAIAQGFRFSTERNDAYRVLPLSQLDEILRSKVIPYFDNVSVLEGIEERIPQVTIWDDIADNLKGNSVFHESCHAVARGFRSGAARSSGAGTPELKTLASLLEESFANTCEFLSVTDAEDQVHRIFIELNSYVYMLDSRPHLKSAASHVGPGKLGCFLMLCYLHANLLREMNEKTFADCVALAGIEIKKESAEMKNLRRLAKVPFELNLRFREVTTRFYLNLSGGMSKVEALKTFDVVRALRSPENSNFLEQATAFFG